MTRQFSRHRRTPAERGKGQPPRLWGRHAVLAALANPDRTVKRIWGTRDALAALDLSPGLPINFCEVTDLARLVPHDAPHQGLVVEVVPLDDVALVDVLEYEVNADSRRPFVILDQVTDPHNIGAVLRSAAAFNAAALITQDRHSPPESGTIAKAASGALEVVPWVRVVNLARAMDEIGEAGWWRIGLDGDSDTELATTLDSSRVALVLGAEGDGMRQNTRDHCDQIARLPISSRMESLNISNAAAIALYAVAVAGKR